MAAHALSSHEVMGNQRKVITPAGHPLWVPCRWTTNMGASQPVQAQGPVPTNMQPQMNNE